MSSRSGSSARRAAMAVAAMVLAACALGGNGGEGDGGPVVGVPGSSTDIPAITGARRWGRRPS